MSENDKISYIMRDVERKPTVIDGIIEDNCRLDNSFIPGISTMIIDEEFLRDFRNYAKETEFPKNLVKCLSFISDYVFNYFSSDGKPEGTREAFYINNSVTGDDEFDLIGTKLSSLKGSGHGKCSEKSVASYIILDQLYRDGRISFKPSIVLSYISVPGRKPEPHAFLMLDNYDKEYPYTHLLFDISNPAYLEDAEGNKGLYVGLFSLDEEQHEKLISGIKCEPTALYEIVTPGVHLAGPVRTYGSLEKEKSM